MPAAKLITGFRNPKVVSISDIEEYLYETNLFEGETYYLDVTKEKIFKDTSIYLEYIDNIKFAFNSDPIVFDSLGNRLLYNGDATCGGVRLGQLYDSLEYFYIKPESKKEGVKSLKEFSTRLQTSKGEKIDLNIFPKTKYYIVQPWNIFFQNKKRMKEDFQWYKNMQDSSKYEFYVIYVNTDMQENWGLKKGAKFKINKSNDLDKLLDERWEENK